MCSMAVSMQQESLSNSASSLVSGANEKFTPGPCSLLASDRVLLAASYCLIGIGLFFVFISTASFGAGILGYQSACHALATGDAMFPLGIASLLSASRLLHPVSQGGASASAGISYELKFGPLAIKI